MVPSSGQRRREGWVSSRVRVDALLEPCEHSLAYSSYRLALVRHGLVEDAITVSLLGQQAPSILAVTFLQWDDT